MKFEVEKTSSPASFTTEYKVSLPEKTRERIRMILSAGIIGAGIVSTVWMFKEDKTDDKKNLNEVTTEES